MNSAPAGRGGGCRCGYRSRCGPRPARPGRRRCGRSCPGRPALDRKGVQQRRRRVPAGTARTGSTAFIQPAAKHGGLAGAGDWRLRGGKLAGGEEPDRGPPRTARPAAARRVHAWRDRRRARRNSVQVTRHAGGRLGGVLAARPKPRPVPRRPGGCPQCWRTGGGTPGSIAPCVTRFRSSLARASRPSSWLHPAVVDFTGLPLGEGVVQQPLGFFGVAAARRPARVPGWSRAQQPSSVPWHHCGALSRPIPVHRPGKAEQIQAGTSGRRPRRAARRPRGWRQRPWRGTTAGSPRPFPP